MIIYNRRPASCNSYCEDSLLYPHQSFDVFVKYHLLIISETSVCNEIGKGDLKRSKFKITYCTPLSRVRPSLTSGCVRVETSQCSVSLARLLIPAEFGLSRTCLQSGLVVSAGSLILLLFTILLGLVALLPTVVRDTEGTGGGTEEKAGDEP